MDVCEYGAVRQLGNYEYMMSRTVERHLLENDVLRVPRTNSHRDYPCSFETAKRGMNNGH